MGVSRDSLLRLGTCSWSTKDWVGKVYSAGTPATEYIREYARRYNTVEIDSTFYATPPPATVDGWRERTPPGFEFACKAPQVITHEKMCVDCDVELRGFIQVMSRLEDRLGPIVFQFPYFAKGKGITQDHFMECLTPFLAKLPTESARFVVEVRNKTWLNEKLFEPLHARGIALALIDHPWMPRPQAYRRTQGLITGPFAYIRWLGDRHGIEKITKTWSEPVIDRSKDLESWTPLIQDLLNLNLPVYGYVNNHYSGHAPADLDLLLGLL